MIGADISEAAINNCRANFTASNVQFLLVDFFAPIVELKGFDLVFDYTFFCAIDPGLRGDWGSRMGAVVGEGKYLLCLMYPLGQVKPEEGPPFGVSDEAYADALRKGFKMIWRSGREVVPCNSRRTDRFMKQELALFQRI